MKVLIYGAGNTLLADEGFGVHFIRYLARHFVFPPDIELLDAGTMGMMLTHTIEEADRVYIVDVVVAEGTPGKVLRYSKDEFMLRRLPGKLSPHQVGVQEMLLICELRGRCPAEVILLGVIPASIHPSGELTEPLASCLPGLAAMLVRELQEAGFDVRHQTVTERRSSRVDQRPG